MQDKPAGNRYEKFTGNEGVKPERSFSGKPFGEPPWPAPRRWRRPGGGASRSSKFGGAARGSKFGDRQGGGLAVAMAGAMIVRAMNIVNAPEPRPCPMWP